MLSDQHCTASCSLHTKEADTICLEYMPPSDMGAHPGAHMCPKHGHRLIGDNVKPLSRGELKQSIEIKKYKGMLRETVKMVLCT